MIAFGIILLIVGFIGIIYGNNLNSDVEAQIMSVWERGVSNPGNIYLYIGIFAAVLGLVLLIIGIVKKNNNNHSSYSNSQIDNHKDNQE